SDVNRSQIWPISSFAFPLSLVVSMEIPIILKGFNGSFLSMIYYLCYKWLKMLIILLLGSFTKKRRTPQGSSVRGYSIAMLFSLALAYILSTSFTSILISG